MTIERKHAFLSASGAHRWLACPPSAKIEEQMPDNESEAAKEGTLAHELAEMKVRNYFYTTDFGNRKLKNAIKKLKENLLWQEEMMHHTDTYLDYIKEIALALPSRPYVAIEQQVFFDQYAPDGFGTADCIMLQGNTLYIMDFKYGKGVPVSAEKNPQLMLYALGAYDTYKILYPIQNIHMSIIQPRLPNGITNWECSLDELLNFGAYVKERAALAMEGNGEFSPGAHTCRFCKAKSRCRARAEENIKLASEIDKKPPLLSNEEVGNYLIQGEDVAKWVSDLKKYALSECLAGREVEGWKAVQGRSKREWKDLDKAFSVLGENGIAEELLWEKVPLSVSQAEKTLGKKELLSFVENYIEKTPGAPTLVRDSDKREAITNQVQAKQVFEEV